MFEINWRITDAASEITCMESEDVDQANVEGFFQLNFNGRTYGYYHGNVLREGETGAELITFWFHLLLISVMELDNSDYVAFCDPESPTWIEFTVGNELVYVNFREPSRPQLALLLLWLCLLNGTILIPRQTRRILL